MRKAGINISPLENLALFWSKTEKRRVVRSGDLVRALNISPKQEANLLTKMSKSGLALQMMRGLYLLPGDLTPVAPWTPSEYFLLALLMKELNIDYQVTGLAAFNFYRLTEQVASKLTVYNTYFSGSKKIGTLRFDFIKTSKPRLGAVQKYKVNDGNYEEYLTIGTEARVIFDAIYDYKKVCMITDAYNWIREKKSDSSFIKELVTVAIDYGNIASRRRLGCLLDQLKVLNKFSNPLLKSLSPTNSLIPMIPWLAVKGYNDRKWGTVINGQL